MNLLRRSRGAAPLSDAERAQKAELRTQRMAMAREARRASSVMRTPEPIWGIYVGAFLVALGLISYLSPDWGQVSKTVHGKTTLVHEIVHYPPQATLLIALTLIAAGSIYWRKRWVTGIAFLMTAMIGLSTPLPQSMQDLTWAGFLAPAGYTMWVMILRLNKDQKDWLAKNSPVHAAQPGPASRKPARSGRNQVSRSRSRSGANAPAATNTGRAGPTPSGRYTPPRPKSKASPRKP